MAPLAPSLLECFQQLILFEAQADHLLIQASSSFQERFPLCLSHPPRDRDEAPDGLAVPITSMGSLDWKSDESFSRSARTPICGVMKSSRLRARLGTPYSASLGSRHAIV
jgi:hypothetical protein